MRVLYISYDGLLEPLGQSQVLAYLRRLAAGHRISVVSYEKPDDWAAVARRDALRADVQAAGIAWHPLRYHKRFSVAATAWDVAQGWALSRRLVRQQGIEIVHARSYVPSLIALRLKRTLGVRYLFDMRGFWPDEKVDAGTWSRTSPVYRQAKRFERTFLTSADAVVSLTQAGVDEMDRFDYLQGQDVEFTVIPAEPRRGPFTLGYVGNTGGWYRFEPVVAAFKAIRAEQPDARLLVVNKGQHEAIRAHLAAYDVPPDRVELTALDFADVPNAIRRMDATAFFIAPTFSKQASAPTKLAEFLGCGVPCLVNDGVGDMGRIVRDDGVGVVVDQVSDATAVRGALKLQAMASDPDVRARCVETARRRFSLEKGVTAYDGLYRQLAAGTVA
jgi:glycosyltransferase involved in cell wall biosynthesis